MNKHTLSRLAQVPICAIEPMAKTPMAPSPLDAAYTAHREAEQRRRATQEWLREREAAYGRRL